MNTAKGIGILGFDAHFEVIEGVVGAKMPDHFYPGDAILGNIEMLFFHRSHALPCFRFGYTVFLSLI